MSNIPLLHPAKQSSNGIGGEWGEPLAEIPWCATIDAFFAHAPTRRYIHRLNGQTWPAATIDNRFGKIEGMKASKWLDRFQHVEQMVWDPGKPEVVRDEHFSGGEWVPEEGWDCYNLYRPPYIDPRDGDPEAAKFWLALLHKIYPNDATHILHYLAHRVQKPGEKINHALVLGGPTRIGKDTILAPVRYAVGTSNFASIEPDKILTRFNKFFQSVILRISEARDMGINKFQFYSNMKSYVAAPPEMLTIDEKNLPTYEIPNITSVIITTNHLTDGMYLPPDDARYYVAWTDQKRDEEIADRCDRLWMWYKRPEAHAWAHVAAYLHSIDISQWNSKVPPPRTEAWYDMVGGALAHEAGDLAELLDGMDSPDAVTLRAVVNNATGTFHQFLTDRANRRLIGHRFRDCGMTPVKNPGSNNPKTKWRWSFGRDHNGSSVTGPVYAKEDLTETERIAAAHAASKASDGIGRLNSHPFENPVDTTDTSDIDNLPL
jgi:hypothetical protein